MSDEVRIAAALGVDVWLKQRRSSSTDQRRKRRVAPKRSDPTGATVSDIQISSDSAGLIVRCRLDGQLVKYRDGLSRAGCDAVLLELRNKMKAGRC